MIALIELERVIVDGDVRFGRVEIDLVHRFDLISEALGALVELKYAQKTVVESANRFAEELRV